MSATPSAADRHVGCIVFSPKCCRHRRRGAAVCRERFLDKTPACGWMATASSKPVPGAVIIQTRADMGPDGMKEMTAPMKALPPKEPGIYRFEVEPGMAEERHGSRGERDEEMQQELGEVAPFKQAADSALKRRGRHVEAPRRREQLFKRGPLGRLAIERPGEGG